MTNKDTNSRKASVYESEEYKSVPVSQSHISETPIKQPEEDYSGAVFERMVIVLPYRAPDAVKTIEQQFESLNITGLNCENVQYLNTKELSEEEKANRSLDFLGGFEIMDKEFRMFIIEGLGGPNKAVDKLYRSLERTRPNDKKFKMLYNPQIRYKNRIYQDFNGIMKRIRLRDPLTKIMGNPDIYLRSKVSQEMYDTLQKFAEIRKQERAQLIRDFNLFPIASNLLQLERIYGDALSYEDINGFRQVRRRRKSRGAASIRNDLSDGGITERSATRMHEGSDAKSH